MMMYHVSESLILNTWSLETLVKKLKNGFNFILIKNGVSPKDNFEKTSNEILESIHDEHELLYSD